jgi:hypothetical protein
MTERLMDRPLRYPSEVQMSSFDGYHGWQSWRLEKRWVDARPFEPVKRPSSK